MQRFSLLAVGEKARWSPLAISHRRAACRSPRRQRALDRLRQCNFMLLASWFICRCTTPVLRSPFRRPAKSFHSAGDGFHRRCLARPLRQICRALISGIDRVAYAHGSPDSCSATCTAARTRSDERCAHDAGACRRPVGDAPGHAGPAFGRSTCVRRFPRSCSIAIIRTRAWRQLANRVTRGGARAMTDFSCRARISPDHVRVGTAQQSRFRRSSGGLCRGACRRRPENAALIIAGDFSETSGAEAAPLLISASNARSMRSFAPMI